MILFKTEDEVEFGYYSLLYFDSNYNLSLPPPAARLACKFFFNEIFELYTFIICSRIERFREILDTLEESRCLDE